MNKFANKLAVVFLGVSALVGLPACSCECTKKDKTGATEQVTTEVTTAPSAEEVSTSVDASSAVVAELPAATEAVAVETAPAVK